jgi:hypothetical protein
MIGVATIPTVGDAIEALNALCDDLTETLKHIADLSAELSSRNHIRVDNIPEVRLHPRLKCFLGLTIWADRQRV